MILYGGDMMMGSISEIEQLASGAERDRMISELWAAFEDATLVLTESAPDGVLANDWAGFAAGTDKYDVWRWFDDHYSGGIRNLLYPESTRFPIMDASGVRIDTYFQIETYASNNNLAIRLLSEEPDDGYLEDYASLTVNIAELPPYAAAIDTNNLPSSIVSALEEKGIAHVTGCIQSGFCTYPVVRFDAEKLAAMDPGGASRYADAVSQKAGGKRDRAPSLEERGRDAQEVIDDAHHDAETPKHHGIEI